MAPERPMEFRGLTRNQKLIVGGRDCVIIQDSSRNDLKGGFGEICTARRIEDSLIFAIKCPLLTETGIVDAKAIRQAKIEIGLLRALSGCPFIVKLISTLPEDTHVSYVSKKIVGFRNVMKCGCGC